MSSQFALVVGLGNPGARYANTRHNVGFWWVDALAQSMGAAWQMDRTLNAEVARAGSLRLVKPQTFMNLSGGPVAALANFHKLAPEQVLVVHDELDCLAGQLRLKIGGGNAGHNGLKDIQARLGSADFWRLRVGIGHPRNSATPQMQVADWVLAPPLADESKAIEASLKRALEAWPQMQQDPKAAMSVVHRDSALNPSPTGRGAGGESGVS